MIKSIKEKNQALEIDLTGPQGNAYFLLGTQLTTQYQLNKSTLKWNLRVENMLNTTYRDYLNRLRYFSDEKGINFIMGVSYEF